MRRGDIVWVDLPQVEGSIRGREQVGPRPAVVIQNESAFSTLPTILIVPITSNLNATRFAGTLLIRANRNNGLDRDSVLLAFQARAIDRHRVNRLIGKLDNPDQISLNSLLQSLLLPAPES